MKTQDRKVQSARAHARAFDQFAAIASVSAQNTIESTTCAGDKKDHGHAPVRRYMDDDQSERSVDVGTLSQSTFTVSALKESIEQGLSLSELKALRRQFARDRHPDRVPVSQRRSATQDMTLANAMIDRAIHELER